MYGKCRSGVSGVEVVWCEQRDRAFTCSEACFLHAAALNEPSPLPCLPPSHPVPHPRGPPVSPHQPLPSILLSVKVKASDET